jgi:hypothetical protein
MLSTGSLYAQATKSEIPTVKIKKKKQQVTRPEARKKPVQIRDKFKKAPSTSTSHKNKDNYQRPASVRKGEKSEDSYKRPASKRVTYQNNPSNDQRRPSPSAEEGSGRPGKGFISRIFSKKNPSEFQGDWKQEKPLSGTDGVLFEGSYRKKKIDYEGQADGIHRHVGGSKSLKIDHEQLARDVHQYQGSIPMPPQRRLEIQKAYQAQHMSLYEGGKKVPTPKRQQREALKTSADLQQAGLYKVRKEKDQAESYTTYHGQIKLPTLKARTRHFEKLSEKVHQYDGDIRYRKPGKDMHPSVFYLKSKVKNSYEQKEKYRRWRIKLSHIFDSNEQPKHLKEKERKPRYDKDESEIWYY